MPELPNVCEEPEPVRRAWTYLREEHGVNLLHDHRQIVSYAVARELANVLRARAVVLRREYQSDAATQFEKAADMIESEVRSGA